MNQAPSILRPLQIVRERTRPLHTQLEAAVNISSHLGSKSAYAELLNRYTLVYAPLEERLDLQPEPIRLLTATFYKPRLPLLLQDRKALGIDDLAPLAPPPFSMPDLETLDQTLGALYVVEGSALGGQLLYREVEQRLGLDASTGAAFFRGAGEATTTTWKSFTTLFNLHVENGELAADSACQTFAAFQSALVLAKGHQP